MYFKPGFQLPPYSGGESLQEEMQAPPVVHIQITVTSDFTERSNALAQALAEDSTDADDVTAVSVNQLADMAGQRLVNQFSGAIHQFWNAQRHNAMLGVARNMNVRHQISPDIMVQYTRIQNTDTLFIEVTPVLPVIQLPHPLNGSFAVDLNFDGYIAWVHAQSDPIAPNTARGIEDGGGSYNIFLNGYKVAAAVELTEVNQCFLVMFGTTALRSHSLVDATNLNPLASKTNGGLAIPISPTPGPAVAALTNFAGQAVPEHARLPSYSPFDWTNVVNPAEPVFTGFDVGFGWGSFAKDDGIPVITQGIQFANPAKSPLVNKGMNQLTIQPITGPAFSEAFFGDAVLVEFYDRQKARVADQSWKFPRQQGQQVLANDIPLQAWTNAFNGNVILGVGMSFDLTPTKGTAIDQQPNVTGNGLSPADQATVAASAASRTAILTAYATALGSINSAVGTMLSDAATLGGFVPTAVSDANSVYGVGTTQGLAVAALAPSFSLLSGALSAVSSAVGALAPVEAGDTTTGPAAMAALTAAEGTAGSAGSSMSTILGNAISVITAASPSFGRTAVLADLGSVNVWLTQVASDLSSLPTAPTPTTFPAYPDVGLSIDGFKWRTVTVSGGNWSFGAWQGG